MTRHDLQRLEDITAAATAIHAYMARGTFDDGMVFDAVRVRLIEIGEAVRALDPNLLVTEPDVPWRDVAAMRNHLAHRYFDTAHAVVRATVDNDLPALIDAVERLLRKLQGAASTDDEL